MSVINPKFPCECSTHIFSFLDVRECLEFGSTSCSALREVLPSLHRRRLRMKQTFAYSSSRKQIERGAAGDQIVGLLEDMQEKYPHLEWVSLPTVQQRVQELYRRVPAFHPLREKVKLLRDDLEIDTCRFENDNNYLFRGVPYPTFVDVFAVMRQLTRALRLHAEILWGAIRSDPLVQQENALLDQYIGDVLCVTHLINDGNLRIVDGSPTNAKFLKELRKQTKGSSCYRSWVYIHSSILRNKPFSIDERRRLGIPDFAGVSELIPNDCYINDFFMSSEMTLVFREFGPLGPAFRGRDIVRLRDIPARCLFAFLITNSLQVPGETSRNALEWLCFLHEQARKARPMTVLAPVVRLSNPPEVHR